ncbi:pyridoxal-phosphate dependent enzyme [Segetibacter sp. 3557_3]|uniref:1-aminocyclopropane-1-carboxylate deaminase/D-cysteine desulfhydrase n=1 Tax=Segetibacter sp. 3557_3 TaxID=2547429 RepID=UPI001058482C|nr:pyridoxal-phosphate dependent enzyme [Segetibacter sp. 3557_3]TDH29141.1 pyridoxal-phosphate dependent enzyme [Segetibacter sp. 3557_3]
MDIKTLPLDFEKVCIEEIQASWLSEKNIGLSVLRLDKLHPVVSGNKWFKLKYYLEEALLLEKPTVATFGGAYSNHIVATAFACKAYGLQSVGIIRGEQSDVASPTLYQAESYGMQLLYVSREQFREKEKVAEQFGQFNWYWIGEGGYGSTGAKGAAEILGLANHQDYTDIVASVGTGTMLAGIIQSARESQRITGVSSLKGNFSLEQEVRDLLPMNVKQRPFRIIHDYHFGGYGKQSEDLIQFIQQVYDEHQLPLDFVYTGKLFYAIKDLVNGQYFKDNASILMIHSGGLQGNASLGKSQLSFL